MATQLQVSIKLVGDSKNLKGAVRDANGEVRKFTDTTERSGKKANQSFKQAEKGAGSLNKGLGDLKTQAALALGAFVGFQALSRTFRAIATEVAQFEQSMAGVAAVTRPTSAEFSAMTEVARELGATTVFSASQAAEGMRFLGQAGFKTRDIISSIPAALDLAAAGSLELADAADIVSNIMSGFAIEATKTTEVADALAETAASANTNIQQLGEAMSYVAPVAQSAGISVQDTAAAIGVLSDAGIQSSRAGTAMLNVISKLAAPTDDARKVLAKLGVKFEEINPQTNSLTEVFTRLSETSIDLTDAITLAGQRGGPAILALTSQAPRLGELTEQVNAANGSAKEMATTLSDTLQGDVKAMQSALSELILMLGDAGLTNAMRLSVQGLTSFARLVGENKEVIQVLSTIIGVKLTLALGGLAAAKAKNIILARQMATGWVVMSRSATAAAVATRGLRLALMAVGGPVGLLVGGLTALTLGLANSSRAMKDMQSRSRETQATIDGLTSSLEEAMSMSQAFEAQKQMVALREEAEKLEAQLTKMQGLRQRNSPLAGSFSMEASEAETAIRLNLTRLENDIESLEQKADFRFLEAAINESAPKVIAGLVRIGEAMGIPTARLREMNQATADEDFIGEFDKQIEGLNETLIKLRGELNGNANALLDYKEQQALATAATKDDTFNTTANTEAVKERFAVIRELRGEISALEAEKERQAEADKKLESGAQRIAQAYQQLLTQTDPVAAEMRELQGLMELASQGGMKWEQALREMGISAANSVQFINLLEQRIAALGGQKFDSFMGDFFGFDDGMVDGLFDIMDEAKDKMQEIADIEWHFDGLMASFHPLAGEMLRLGDIMDQIDISVGNGVSKMEAGLAKTGAAANAAFGAIMSGMDRASSEYKAMEAAQLTLNTALGIAAILQQGMGDPYTAIPRMIAMAALVAQFVSGISGIMGGGSGGAERRQEQQGTGTILGDPTAKSKSIENAVEITADATQQLVGINRGMLYALQDLQKGLTGASTMLAQRGEVDFGSMNLDLGTFNNISNDIWDPLGFFSSTKVQDEGIQLLGGAIADMTEGAVGEAFQIVKKKGLFGSSKKTGTADLGEALNNQLNLIFESMIDTVRSAGEALGIPLEALEARIAAFEVEAQKISLKDLDAEEQQAALEAVFSRIFDDLANAVIPFIGQFQQIGEGMGETLVRVATSVQVAEEAIFRLGLSISDNLGPERMAQISVGLVEAAGGIEQFITKMENFIAKFAPEAHKFDIAQRDVTRALEQMGIALPESRDGFWELVQAIDTTTEAGQRQVATLLGLADAADTYYDKIEDIEEERAGLEQQILKLKGEDIRLRYLELQTLDESNRALQRRVWALEREIEREEAILDLNQELLQSIAPAWAEFNNLYRSLDGLVDQAKRLGFNEEQLGRVRDLANHRIKVFIGELQASIQSLSEQLFGGSESIGSSMSNTASQVSSSMTGIRDSMLNALQQIQDWLDSSLLGNNSPLTPTERLDEAKAQFEKTFASAMTGDVDALSKLTGMADQLLGEAGNYYGTSTSDYQAIFDSVRGMMKQAGNLDPGLPTDPTYRQMANVESNTESTAMSAMEELKLAGKLAQEMALLAELTGKSPAEIGREFGIPIAELMELLTGEVPGLTGEALSEAFNDLVGDMTSELNVLMDVEEASRAQVVLLERIWKLMSGAAPSKGGHRIPDPIDPVEGLTGLPPNEEDSGASKAPPPPSIPDPPGGSIPAPTPDPGRGSIGGKFDQSIEETNYLLSRIERAINSGNTNLAEGLESITRENKRTRLGVGPRKTSKV